MTALAIVLSIVAVLLTHLFARLIARAAPSMSGPERGPRWTLTAALLAVASGVGTLAGRSWLAWVSARFGVAESGPMGALVALTLTLAALLTLGAFLHLLPSRPLPRRPWLLLFGIASDGTALESVRQPLRWGAWTLIAVTIFALALTPSAPSPWAAACALFVALSLALTPPLAAPVRAPELALAPTKPDPHLAFHHALGDPALFEREPAATTSDTFVDHIVAAAFEGPSPRLTAVQAPTGAGKRRAAEQIARRLAAEGRASVWVDTIVGTQSNRTSPSPALASISVADLASGSHPRLGLIVLDAALAQSAEALATLRFVIHRVRTREALAIDVLVLGERPSVLTVARAIGAAEPHLITPREALPTRPIMRYLLAARPDPQLLATAPPDAHFIALDRPAPLARYPAPSPDSATIAREYLVPIAGPLGRRMREDRAISLSDARPSRLLVALPGDRDAPERRHGLARAHLRAALAEAPQDVDALATVFSRALVEHELAALSRAGLLSHLQSWRPTSVGLVAAPHVSARLPRDADHGQAATVALTEPRSGRTRAVPQATVDFDYFDGAITTLDNRAAGERFEVRGPHRALVPTTLTSATPLRTLSATLAEAPIKHRLRFRGARDVEVWEAPIDLHATHFGVRQFGDDGHGEARAYTRLLPVPLTLTPLRTGARIIIVSDGHEAPPSAPALHAIVHALREVAPVFFDSASDLGVTYMRSDEASGQASIVFYDTHPEGLGTCADLRDDDLEALFRAAVDLLTCDCAAHCAKCCESVRCTSEVPLDRREAGRILSALVMPRAIPLGVNAHAAALRRTA